MDPVEKLVIFTFIAAFAGGFCCGWLFRDSKRGGENGTDTR